jgi:hypothetical protein
VSRHFNLGTGQCLTRAAAGLGGNLTMSAHVYPHATQDANVFVEYVDATNYMRTGWLQLAGTNTHVIYTVGGCTGAPVSPFAPLNAWWYLSGEHRGTGANQTKLWQDAGAWSATANCMLAASGGLWVGQLGNGSQYYDGLVSHLAQWSSGLSDSEQVGLSRRVSPRRIRPTSLTSYWELSGNASPEPDTYGRRELSLIGSPAKSPERAIFRPLGLINVGVPGAGPVVPGRNVLPLCPCCGYHGTGGEQ